MATLAHRPAPVLSVVLLLVLPGCATEALWTEGWEPRLEWTEQAANLGIEIGPDQAVAGALSVRAQRSDGHRMPWWSGVGQRRSWWRLSPEEAGEEGRFLLGAADGFVVRGAEVEMRRDFREGDIVRSDAHLRLDVTMDAAAVAIQVAAERLPPATRGALRRVRARDVFLPVAAEPMLPMLLEHCVERLASIDPSPLFGTGPTAPCAVLVNYAWVDRDLRPVLGKSQVEALCGGGLDDPAPLAERLGKLAPLSLLVEVATGEGRTLFCLRPEFVWLWGAMRHDGRGHFVHESSWHAMPVGGAGEALPRQVVSGTMRVRFFTWRFEYDYFEKIARKVLATPFAVAFDLFMMMLDEGWLRVLEVENQRRRRG